MTLNFTFFSYGSRPKTVLLIPALILGIICVRYFNSNRVFVYISITSVPTRIISKILKIFASA